MYPYFMAKTGAFFFFVFGVLALLSTIAQINPIWLYGPYTPASISAGSQPDFYMGFLEGTLRVFPSWTWDLGGHTVAWNVLIPALVPLGVFFTGAALWPFIEQWATGDRAEHHVNDRPRNAPTRTAIGVAAITFYIILLLEGANDLVADYLHIPLYTVTWIARVAWSSSARPSPTSSPSGSASGCSARTGNCCTTGSRPASSGSCRPVSSSRCTGRCRRTSGPSC